MQWMGWGCGVVDATVNSGAHDLVSDRGGGIICLELESTKVNTATQLLDEAFCTKIGGALDPRFFPPDWRGSGINRRLKMYLMLWPNVKKRLLQLKNVHTSVRYRYFETSLEHQPTQSSVESGVVTGWVKGHDW